MKTKKPKRREVQRLGGLNFTGFKMLLWLIFFCLLLIIFFIFYFFKYICSFFLFIYFLHKSWKYIGRKWTNNRLRSMNEPALADKDMWILMWIHISLLFFLWIFHYLFACYYWYHVIATICVLLFIASF